MLVGKNLDTGSQLPKDGKPVATIDLWAIWEHYASGQSSLLDNSVRWIDLIDGVDLKDEVDEVDTFDIVVVVDEVRVIDDMELYIYIT